MASVVVALLEDNIKAQYISFIEMNGTTYNATIQV